MAAYIKLIITLLVPYIAFSQIIPEESPNSILKQKIGLEYVTIIYGRPGVKGREIFGDLVPYGEIWRTGANYPTFIELKDTAFFGEESFVVPPGKYAIYTIPSEKAWTVILSKNTQLWGAFGYESDDDLCRFLVKSQVAPFTETFSIEFVDVKISSATLSFKWERTEIKFPLRFDIHNKVIDYIKKEISGDRTEEAGLYRKGATYLLNEHINSELAYEWARKSVELDSNWLNLWCKAEVLAWMNHYQKAIQTGENALKDGLSDEQVQFFPYEKSYRNKLNHWRDETEE